jgi:acetyltransferase
MIAFHRTLSDFSVHYRYFCQLPLEHRIAHDRLARICFNDYDREIALVAELKPRGASEGVIIGVGRLSKLHCENEIAEFAIIVSDEWQGEGAGTKLLSQLIEIARQEKLARLIGHILTDNAGMLHVCRRLGFTLRHDDAAEEIVAELKL